MGHYYTSLLDKKIIGASMKFLFTFLKCRQAHGHGLGADAYSLGQRRFSRNKRPKIVGTKLSLIEQLHKD